jgi:hypothetical protein
MPDAVSARARHDTRVVRIGDFASAPDAAAASWVVERVRGFAESVLSLVPAGFEAYGRIFHPAWRWDPTTRVSWREVAEANGRVAHRTMQWESITGALRFYHGDHQPGIWDHEPEEGSLPQELAPVLASLLAQHTATPDRCWFAVWEGFGCLDFGDDEPPAFKIPARRLLLLTGPITAVMTSLCPPPWWQSPTLWWPDDRAWCVETEVDLMASYVGGSRQLIEELVAHDEMEAMAADPGDGVTLLADELNPPPA